MLTLGAQNARVGLIRDLQQKRGRAAQRAYAIEGPTLLEEALRSGASVRELYVTETGARTTPAVARLEAAGVPVYLAADRVFAKLSDVETPAGLLAVLDLPSVPLETLFSQPGVVLATADLGDPGNLGTLLRAAEAFGARGALVGDAGVDPFHPKVVRAGMGAHFRLPIATCSPEAALEAASRAGASIVGLAASGRPLRGMDWPSRTLLVVGHERQGLGRWEPLCEATAGIPMAAGADSLNAGVAGSIALYEALSGRLL